MTADRRKALRGARPEPEGFLRSLVSRNLGLKLFSLVLGLVIFLAVRNEQEMTATVSARLLLKEPDHLVNTADVPPEVMVRIAGTSGRLRSLDLEAIEPIEIDLTSFEKGMSLVRIREEQLGLPSNLKVLAISPSALTVKLEARDRKRVPIRAAVQGRPAPGHLLDSITVEPKDVVVEGPQRELRELRVIHTAPVEIEGAEEDVVATVALDLPSPHTRLQGEVRPKVTVRVAAERIERTVRVPVDGGGAGVFHASARLRGPRSILDSLDEASLRGLPEASPKLDPRTPRPVRIEGLPEGVEVLEPRPTVVLPAPGRPPGPRR
ncbi:MAG TPA: CdaR family protein [Vulgatibacter sp.]|nr:CdaR family protein [Vulgatibacter sp.]